MADNRVKWIKITTDMFDDEKIDFISSLPEADAIIVIWIRLLSLAGKCNAGGYIYLTESIPYTDDMLSHKFRRPLNVIKLALDTLQRLGMIEYEEGTIFIANWTKHQNIEGLELIRERDRERKRKGRADKKLLLLGETSLDSPRTILGCPQTELDLELDKEIDILTPSTKVVDKENDIEIFFKSVWSLYPVKKGKVKQAQKVKLYKLGADVVTKCIDLYKKDVDAQRKNGFKDLQYKNGSTFFNGGYEDYLNTQETDKPARPPLTITVEERD